MASIISASTTAGTALNMSADTTGVLQLATGATPTTAVTIDTSQNVGIGTASPAQKLDVTGSVAGYLVTRINNTNASGQARILFDINSGTNGQADISYAPGIFFTLGPSGNDTTTPIVFRNNNATERMRIDSSGNVLIGTTTLAGGKINAVNSSGLWVQKLQDAAANGSMIQFITSSGSQAGSITISGTTTSYGSGSDYRLKDDIQPLTNALSKVESLKPVSWKWKANNSNGQGFIAHELAEVVPDAVVGEKDAVDEEGKIIPQMVDTSFLVATLTAAIQEQQTIINDLKTRIETLESK